MGLGATMPVVLTAAVAIGAYFFAALFEWPSVRRRQAVSPRTMQRVALLAVVAHGSLLYQYYWVMKHFPSLILSLSLSSWCVACLLVIACFFRPIKSLQLVVFPITVVTLWVGLFFPMGLIQDPVLSPVLAFHVFLSLLTFAVFCVAGLQAMFIFYQQYCLHTARSNAFVLQLPALQTMEKCLFEMLTLGFILLTLLLITATIFFKAQLFHVEGVGFKALLALVAWLVFAGLLVGRYLRGWRGRWVMVTIVAGFFLIWLVYFGSQLLGAAV